MAISSQPAMTPDGIREGDPAALAALVEHRANAVLAYCEAVCSPAGAERAAAETFARFRAAVAAAEDARSLDPAALLLGATRHASASLTITPTPPADGGMRRKLGAGRAPSASETCTLIPGLLAARAEGALSAADRERLARHLERHPACRALADAVDRAEAGYASPPSRMVPIGALTEIMVALTAAAPITAVPRTDLDFADVILPTTESDESEPVLHEPPPAAALPPEPSTAVFRAVAVDVDEVDEQPRAETDHTVVLPPSTAFAVPAAAGGVAHPRPPHRHRHLYLPSPTRNHGVVYHFVLPGAFIAAALLAAMGVAGVFSTDERQPAASPVTTNAPVAPSAGAPPVTPTAGVDAQEREALAAERRERADAAKRRGARGPAQTATPTTRTETTPQAVVAPDPDPAPPAATAPRRAPRQTSTAEKEPPAESSSALPDTGSATTPSADPGVFEGTPAPAP